ncbi:DUF4831 family protein [uncultured Alloprevotella sp.]|uniref:DUF4831 family protein n=1 Tax=uncultured Alloprevotella sp. TaxID=1283315 RepID=UPI00261E05DA|nr:DUF4831 family protein [uncultured Alloprevotella sp.]
MKKIIFLLLLLIPCILPAQTDVKDYEPGVTEEGITYFLPKTEFYLVITTTRTTQYPGEFAPFAARYLKMDQVALQKEEAWKMQRVNLVASGIADHERAFSIKLKNKTSAPLVALARDGRLLAINADAQSLIQIPQPRQVDDKRPMEDPAKYKTQEILAAGSKEKMAELTANEIFDIRESRSQLSKGQADYMPKDGEQLKLMLANLDRQEEGLLKLFTGTDRTDTITFVLKITFDHSFENKIICRFSTFLGLVDANDLAGEPVYLTIEEQKEAIEPKDNADKPQKAIPGVRYCVPGKALIRLKSKETEYLKAILPVAQFGKIENLGNELFNKHFNTHVTFDETTGGIIKVTSDEQ